MTIFYGYPSMACVYIYVYVCISLYNIIYISMHVNAWLGDMHQVNANMFHTPWYDATIMGIEPTVREGFLLFLCPKMTQIAGKLTW